MACNTQQQTAKVHAYHHWSGVETAGEELLLADDGLAKLFKARVDFLEHWNEGVERLRLAHVLRLGHVLLLLRRVLLPLQRRQAGLRVQNYVPLHLWSRRDAVIGGGELVL